MNQILSLALGVLLVSSAQACPERGLNVEGTNCLIFASLVQCNQKEVYQINRLELINPRVALLRDRKTGAMNSLTVKDIKDAPAAQGIVPLSVVYTSQNQLVYTVYRLPNGDVVRMDSNTNERGEMARGLFVPEAELDEVTRLMVDYKAGGCQ